MPPHNEPLSGSGRPPVWGPLASLFWTGVVWVAFNALTLAMALVFLHAGWADAHSRPDQLAGHGLFLSVSTLVNAVLCTALVLLLIRLRGGLAIRDYLALQPLRGRQIQLWFGLLLVFVLTSEGLGYWLDRPVIPDFMRVAYSTASVPLLFWLAVVVAAPVFEEILFRGFLQGSLARSGFHAGGTLLLPALIWAAIHLQYDLYDVSWVFLFGILLGLARWHTESLYMPVLMHMLVNLLATAVTASLLS